MCQGAHIGTLVAPLLYITGARESEKHANHQLLMIIRWQGSSSYGTYIAPLQGNYKEVHLQGNYSEVPLQSNYSNVPFQGNYSEAPLQGNYSEAPLQGNYSNVPLQGYYSEAPLQGNYSSCVWHLAIGDSSCKLLVEMYSFLINCL